MERRGNPRLPPGANGWVGRKVGRACALLEETRLWGGCRMFGGDRRVSLRHLPTTVVVGSDRSAVEPIVCGVDDPPTMLRDRSRMIDYFSLHAARSVGWYRSKFPFAIRVARKQGHVLESSLSYLPTPSALRQMRQVLPKIRVVAVVSDPVERAYSHYLHRRANAGETRSFAECVAEEIRSKLSRRSLATLCSRRRRRCSVTFRAVIMRYSSSCCRSCIRVINSHPGC